LMKLFAVPLCFWRECNQSTIRSNPKMPVTRFKELKYPIGRQSVAHRVHSHDLWWIRCVIDVESKETTITSSSPELALMIFEQVVKIFIRQTIASRIVSECAIRPAAIQSARRRNP